MSNLRAASIRGPGYLTLDSATTPSRGALTVQFLDNTVFEENQITETVGVSWQGDIDESRKDFQVTITGTPRVSNFTNATWLDFFFPWLGVITPGTPLFGSSDFPCVFIANNGDQYGIYNTACVQMPDITLHIGKPMLGPVKIMSLIRNGFAPETENAYYIKSTGNTWAPPALGQLTGDNFGNQRYYANWAAGNTATGNASFTNFQGKEGITISHDLKVELDVVNGLTIGAYIKSYRPVLRMIPFAGGGATTLWNDIELAQFFTGNAGTGPTQGSLLSQNSAGTGACGDLVVTGQNAGKFTLKNAVIRKGKSVFGMPLRVGEIEFIGTYNYTTSTPTGGLLISTS